jgi:hypothetical protein
MKAIRDFAGQPLLWVQPKVRKQQFELQCGDEVLAVMRWPSNWRTGAKVETAEESWSFKRQGFRQQVTIATSREDAVVPALQRSWLGKATLSFPDGHTYLWKRTSFWGLKRVWMTAEGMPLLSLKARSGFLKMGSEVEIDALAATLPELPLLVTLGWYLAIMEMRDASAAAGAASASAAMS